MVVRRFSKQLPPENSPGRRQCDRPSQSRDNETGWLARIHDQREMVRNREVKILPENHEAGYRHQGPEILDILNQSACAFLSSRLGDTTLPTAPVEHQKLSEKPVVSVLWGNRSGYRGPANHFSIQ